MRKCRTAGGNV